MSALLLAAAPWAARPDVVLWNSSREDRAVLERLAAKYNAQQGSAAPRVTVVTVPFDALADRVTGAIPRGKGPDLFLYPQDRLGTWAEAQLIEPLDAYLDPVTRAEFLPAALGAATFHGATYAVPLGLKVLALYHNRKLTPVAPTSTTDLEAISRKLTNRERGTFGLVYRYSDYWFHAALQNGFGGGVFDARMRPVIDSPENLGALQLVLRWRSEFLPEKIVTIAAAEELFNEGRAAMVFEGPWFRSDVAQGIDYGVAVLPTITEAGGRPMRPWLTVDNLYVSARSSQKLAAFAFARYLGGVEASRCLALEGAVVPANQKAYVDPAMLRDATLAVFLRQARVSVPMPNVPEMTLMWPPATAALGAAVQGTQPPGEALGRAQARLVRAISDLRPPPTAGLP